MCKGLQDSTLSFGFGFRFASCLGIWVAMEFLEKDVVLHDDLSSFHFLFVPAMGLSRCLTSDILYSGAV